MSLVLLLLACSGSDPTLPVGDPPAPTDPAPAVDPPGTDPLVSSVSCTVQPENSLRADCDVVLREPRAEVSVGFTEVGGAQRGTLLSEAGVQLEHRVTLWGMRAAQAHEVTVWVDGVDEATTTFESGPLPALLELIDVTTTGSDPVADYLMMAMRCDVGEAFLSILDPEGTVFWYQQTTDHISGGLFNPTDDGGVLMLSPTQIEEWSMQGELRRVLTRYEHYQRRTHHDGYKHNGLTYVLFADTYMVGTQEIVLDGIYVFDDSGAVVGEWELADHLEVNPADLAGLPPREWWEDEFPGAIDYSHANSVFVDDSGIYISTRWLSTIWKLGSFGTPEFGEVQWRLVGERNLPVPADFVIESEISSTLNFKGQHHGTIAPDGTLTLFDNRRGMTSTSRALAFDLDPTAGVADMVEAYDLGLLCDIQGTVVKDEAGDLVAVCSPTGTIHQFRSGESTESFTFTASCNGMLGETIVFPRALPVKLPSP